MNVGFNNGHKVNVNQVFLDCWRYYLERKIFSLGVQITQLADAWKSAKMTKTEMSMQCSYIIFVTYENFL